MIGEKQVVSGVLPGFCLTKVNGGLTLGNQIAVCMNKVNASELSR